MSRPLPRSLEDLPERHRREVLKLLSAGPDKVTTIDSTAPPYSKQALSKHGMGAPPKRISQRTKPKSNKTETRFGNWLRLMHPGKRLYEQDITLLLANGVRYTPDWAMTHDGVLTFYEVKGPKAWDDSIAKLKMAASVYSEFAFILAWEENRIWQSQAVYQ